MSASEGPYKLPEGWRWVRLGEVCEINPRRPRIMRDFEAPTTFVPMSAVDEKDGTIVASEEKPFALVRRGYTYFEEGDVLFAKITPCMENGKAAIASGLRDGIGFGSTEFHVLRPRGSVISEWIWLFVRRESFRQEAKKAFRGGVGQQRVPQEFLENYLIPLPPLSEQRRIVARIEELMERIREARRLREEARQDTERLWQSVLAEIFPRPGDKLPEGWRWVRLGEVCSIFSGVWGNDPSEPPPPKMKNVKVIRVSDIKENLTIDYKAAPLRLVKQDEAIKYALRHGDLVVVKSSGSMAKVISGRTALFQEQDKIYIPSNFTFALRPKQDMVSSLFLWYWLNAEPAKVMVKGMVSAFTYPNLKKADYIQMLIPLPPLSEQRRIVAHLEAVQERIQALKEKQAATEAELKRLERAILEKAFRGEL